VRVCVDFFRERLRRSPCRDRPTAGCTRSAVTIAMATRSPVDVIKASMPPILRRRRRRRRPTYRRSLSPLRRRRALPPTHTHTPKKTRAVDTPEFAEALIECGYTRLVVQKGAGEYAPTRLAQGQGARLRVELSLAGSGGRVGGGFCPCSSRRASFTHHSLCASVKPTKQHRTFDFVPSLASLLSDAALVVSHAGSGSVFEALSSSSSPSPPQGGGGREPRRPALVVVANPLLMDNHQAELAEHLAREGVAACAEPGGESLAAAVRAVANAPLRPYARGDPSGIVARIDWLAGRQRRPPVAPSSSSL